MKRIDDKTAEALMDKFLAGETTIAQEKELYRYFASGEVAPVLLQHREMMRWYGSLSTAKQRRGLLSLGWRGWIRAAAAVAVIATLTVMLFSPAHPIDEEYLAYTGSYVIIDGKKYTDLERILPQVKEGERLADSISRVVASIRDMPNPVETAIAAQVSDPETRQMIIETIYDN